MTAQQLLGFILDRMDWQACVFLATAAAVFAGLNIWQWRERRKLAEAIEATVTLHSYHYDWRTTMPICRVNAWTRAGRIYLGCKQCRTSSPVEFTINVNRLTPPPRSQEP